MHSATSCTLHIPSHERCNAPRGLRRLAGEPAPRPLPVVFCADGVEIMGGPCSGALSRVTAKRSDLLGTSGSWRTRPTPFMTTIGSARSFAAVRMSAGRRPSCSKRPVTCENENA
ncbi:hypothetical protein C8T65DRAFT_671229 [Cerioporus squamosus]|nr:hypothetical protein C8T65DRAFT_671229 [Cerioporus squamosus]